MRVERLIVHHSAGEWGDVEYLRRLHIARGWRDIGYHKIILGPYPTYVSWAQGTPSEDLDGVVKQGRPDDMPGAHCPGQNSVSLGICVIGHMDAYPPTTKQYETLVNVCARLCQRYGLSHENIHGHREFRATRCPGRHMDIGLLQADVAIAMRCAVC